MNIPSHTNQPDIVTIHLFSFGDSKYEKSWSGIPFFVHHGLNENNVKVINSNMSLPRLTECYNFLAKQLNRISSYIIGKSSMKMFSDSIIGHYIILLYVLLRTLWYHNVDINLFLTYTYGSTAFPRRKTILYCDQTYYQAYERAKHRGLIFKRGQTRVRSENSSLRKATCLFSTLPVTIQHLRNTGYSHTHSKSINFISLLAKQQEISSVSHTEKDHYELLFIGREQYNRGVDVLLDIYIKLLPLIDRPVHLNIVGFKQTEVLGTADLPGEVKFYKYLDKANKHDLAIYTKLLSDASLFVMPQRGSLLAGAMFEALYYATPVITTDVEGMREFITNGENGVLIEKADSKMFVKVIAELLSNRKQLNIMSRNAAKSVECMTKKNAMKELLLISMNAIYSTKR